MHGLEGGYQKDPLVLLTLDVLRENVLILNMNEKSVYDHWLKCYEDFKLRNSEIEDHILWMKTPKY